MGNMGYCRFENTLEDLIDCYDHINDELSKSEIKARRLMVDVCRDFIAEYEATEENDNEQR